ncbi:hypothetical protein ACYSNR_07260 [Enterococcus sp. LJL128]|uniref:hypothetical protein n=1 Tax=Enterococcus sp. LJL51 TaxID=3416656 RepID=UPI003CEF5B91
MCRVINDKSEIEKYVYSFFFCISDIQLQRILSRFARKEGFGEEFMGFLFSDEIDESFHAYGKLKNNQILFSIDQPAANEDCEAYLSFEEFYKYIETAINRVIQDGYEKYDELEIRKLLAKVKQALNVLQ